MTADTRKVRVEIAVRALKFQGHQDIEEKMAKMAGMLVIQVNVNVSEFIEK